MLLPLFERLFLNRLDTLPLPPQVLLPQTDLIIRTTHRQHIPAQTPAHPPNRCLKVQHLALPLAWGCRIGRPDAHRLVLRCGGDVALLQNSGGPGYVAYPVGVTRESLPFLLVLRSRGVEGPDLENVVTTTRHEPPVPAGARTGVAAHNAARGGSRRPADGVDTQTMSMMRDMVDGVVLELQNRHVSVGGRAGEEAAGLVGRPGDDVDGGLV